MGDTVGGGNGRLGKVKVTEFYGVGEYRSLVGDVHDMKVTVMVEGRADV